MWLCEHNRPPSPSASVRVTQVNNHNQNNNNNNKKVKEWNGNNKTNEPTATTIARGVYGGAHSVIYLLLLPVKDKITSCSLVVGTEGSMNNRSWSWVTENSGFKTESVLKKIKSIVVKIYMYLPIGNQVQVEKRVQTFKAIVYGV